MGAEIEQLNPILHQPVRTRIAAFLVARGEATFTEIKKSLEITDGNLDAHMKKLVAADYIVIQKGEGKGRQQTVYSLSELGGQAFKEYIIALQNLLGIEADS